MLSCFWSNVRYSPVRHSCILRQACSASSSADVDAGRRSRFGRRKEKKNNKKSPSEKTATSISEVQEFLKKKVFPALVDPITIELESLDKNVHKVGSIFKQDLCVTPGLYLNITLRRHEPVLRDRVMKADHFTGLNILPTLISAEVPNFRPIDGPGPVKIFGCGQPTEKGIKEVINHLSEKGITKITWVTLREEPFAYVNGRPFSPREYSTLNINLDNFIGIEGFDLESLESRLKADIVDEILNNDGQFEFIHQTESMENEKFVEKAPIANVKTVREIFKEWVERRLLQQKEIKESKKPAKQLIPRVSYSRIPITDEQRPEEKAFDDLVYLFQTSDRSGAMIFNCQMGRGRTTTALVCALLLDRQLDHSLKPMEHIEAEAEEVKKVIAGDFKNGGYQVVEKLVNSLPNGPLIKWEVDQAIDSCHHLQNIREAIYDCKVQSEIKQEVSENSLLKPKMTPLQWRERGELYLERYFYLLIFNIYLHEQAPVEFRKTFSEWLKRRWGLRRLAKEIRLE